MRTLVLLLALAAGARAAAAQRPADPRVDSLLVEIRALKARLDSLQGRDTASGALAQLRARARAAAGGTERGDTARQVAGARNLNQLNPEISVTGDLRGALQTEGAQRESFEAREFEFAFQAALDPYSHTKIFAAIEEGEIDIEEAYFYYTGLPGRLRLDVGRYRQQLGELNRWHLHAVPEAEYPLALLTYAGEEGLIGTGFSAYWHTSGLGTHELWGQVTLGDNEGLFEGGDRPAYLVHLNNFWQVTRATYMQIGATGVYGTNPDEGLKTRLGSLDVRFTWRPPARAKYREWNLRGELLAIEKERAGAGDVRYGWYVGTNYKLGQRWVAGARYDYVEAPEGPFAIVRQVVPSLTFWQSEWVKLHAEWQHRREAGVTENLIVLQAVWSIGPHKHEIY
ncbi:MAG TPA: hypothetical protein VGA20_01635 [Gemmatimonadales bacterium]